MSADLNEKIKFIIVIDIRGHHIHVGLRVDRCTNLHVVVSDIPGSAIIKHVYEAMKTLVIIAQSQLLMLASSF